MPREASPGKKGTKEVITKVEVTKRESETELSMSCSDPTLGG